MSAPDLHPEVEFYDDYYEDEEEDREAECGRWINGRLGSTCLLAGTEWCDWECPLSR